MLKLNFQLIFFLILVFILFLFPIGNDGDFFHHLNTGKYIFENWSLPYKDIWTYTAYGQPWIAHSWASGLLFYLIFSNFNQIGISIFSSLIAVVSFLLGYLLLRTYGISKLISIISLLTILPLIQTRWPARPEIISYPLLLAILLIDQISIKNPSLKWFFPLIILLWANLYGANAIVGLLIILLIGVREFFNNKTFTLYIIFPISILASLLNGYGFDTLFYFNKLQSIAPLQLEWSSVPEILFTTPDSYLEFFQYKLIAYFLFLLLLIGLTIPSLKRIKKNYFILTLALSIVIPFFAFRYLPLTAFLTLPLLGFLLKQIKSTMVLSVVLAIGIIGIPISIWKNQPLVNIYEQPFSTQLIKFAKDNSLEGRVFNNQNFGAFLSFYLYPRIEVLVDTRDDLFLKTDILKETLKPERNVLQLLEKYQPDLIITDYSTSPLSYKEIFNSEDWKIIFFDDEYFIAVKTETAQSKNLKVLEGLNPYP